MYGPSSFASPFPLAHSLVLSIRWAYDFLVSGYLPRSLKYLVFHFSFGKEEVFGIQNWHIHWVCSVWCCFCFFVVVGGGVCMCSILKWCLLIHFFFLCLPIKHCSAGHALPMPILASTATEIRNYRTSLILFNFRTLIPCMFCVSIPG